MRLDLSDSVDERVLEIPWDEDGGQADDGPAKKPRKKKKQVEVDESTYRKWRDPDNREIGGPGFYCKKCERFYQETACAIGRCGQENRGCPYFCSKEAKQHVIEYHEKTGKEPFSYLYTIYTNSKGVKKLLLPGQVKRMEAATQAREAVAQEVAIEPPEPIREPEPEPAVETAPPPKEEKVKSVPPAIKVVPTASGYDMFVSQEPSPPDKPKRKRRA